MNGIKDNNVNQGFLSKSLNLLIYEKIVTNVIEITYSHIQIQ